MRTCREIRQYELVHVYFAYFPEHGPEQRLYDNDDIQRAGGIDQLEAQIRRESYWCVYLGVVKGSDNGNGIEIARKDLAALPQPAAETWRIGERNPSLGRGEPEDQIFDAIFKVLAEHLESWTYEDDGAVYRHSVKELHLNGQRLSRSAAALAANGDHENLDVTFTAVLHWHGIEYPWRTIDGLTEDMNLGPVRLRVPLGLKREGEKISAKVLEDMRSW
jgi:hypothetical protein